MSHTPETLCQRAREGDGDAAEELISLFYQRLYGWFRRLTGHDADAADLTQKTFVKLWATLQRFEGRSSFSTWLHAIGHHVYVDWRRQKNPTLSLPEEWWTQCANETPLPDAEINDRESAQKLFALVEHLEEDTRETVHLHYYEGLSLAETAEVLGIATSTVKYRLRQAIDQLRSKFNNPPQFQKVTTYERPRN